MDILIDIGSKKIGSTIVINPGESAGMMKGKNAIGIINLEKMEFKRDFSFK